MNTPPTGAMASSMASSTRRSSLPKTELQDVEAMDVVVELVRNADDDAGGHPRRAEILALDDSRGASDAHAHG